MAFKNSLWLMLLSSCLQWQSETASLLPHPAQKRRDTEEQVTLWKTSCMKNLFLKP